MGSAVVFFVAFGHSSVVQNEDLLTWAGCLAHTGGPVRSPSDVAVSTRSAGAVSHPGHYATYLNVRGKADVLQKVKKVWASTFNARSVAYRLRKGLPVASGRIGVAVLEMVHARSAGIAFSIDPTQATQPG